MNHSKDQYNPIFKNSSITKDKTNNVHNNNKIDSILEFIDIKNNYGFPYEQPYPEQLKLMNAIYECINSSSIGLFESPTGSLYHIISYIIHDSNLLWICL